MSQRSSQLIPILLLILIVVGSVFFVVPMRDNIENLQIQKAESNESLALLQSEYDDLNALSEEISKSQATQDALKKAVPAGMAQDELILELIDMAKDLGFDANVLSFSLRTDKDYGNTVGISLSLTGAYDDLIEYLQLLEGADRLMSVTSISVQRTNTEAISFGVNLEAYYQ